MSPSAVLAELARSIVVLGDRFGLDRAAIFGLGFPVAFGAT